jgi:hypothetical protein
MPPVQHALLLVPNLKGHNISSCAITVHFVRFCNFFYVYADSMHCMVIINMDGIWVKHVSFDIWFLSCSVTKNNMYQLMQPQIDIIIFEIIFPLMCFNDNDQKLWDEDPHEYVRKGYGKSSFSLYFCLRELIIITCPLCFNSVA